jgi:adenosylcobinamide kinase / adenosylcobinamide-phosphate guanylyltransferase
LTLVLGGAASGKSRFAEDLVTGFGLPRFYIATAQALDDEMAAKIARHQRHRGPDWTLAEAPYNLADALAAAPDDHGVLVDCLTLWLSNGLLRGDDPQPAGTALLGALMRVKGPVVCVSSDVGQGLVPDTVLGRRFRDAQGRLNQRVAAQADLVVLVTAGIAQVLKGCLPEKIT